MNKNSGQNIDPKVLSFINKIYSNPAINKSLAQDIIKYYEELIHTWHKTISESLKIAIPIEYHKNIDDNLKNSLFKNFNSDWKCMKHLKDSSNFIKPHPFYIGEIADDKRIEGTTVWSKKKCYGQFIPLRKVLQKYLELPNVFLEISNYMKQESLKSFTDENRIYTSLFQGALWISLSQRFAENTVIPIYLYYDEFEISDPLSSAAGIHKIGGLYCSIAALPPKFASKLDNIFLLQFIYNTDYKEFGAQRCFQQVVTEFEYLIKKGISISVNGENHHVYFVLISLLGDNLALNSLLGYNECFQSNYYCRFCRMDKQSARTQCFENKKLLRNFINYEEDLLSKSNGVKARSIFNSVPFYHNTINWSCDVMHDLYLGICRYDMAKIIKHCIKQHYFSLAFLNDRLKFFNHCEIDCGNKISSISENHIKQEYLIITAAEMSSLIAYFGVIVGDLIDSDDPGWQLYSLLFEIVDLVTSTTITEDDVIYLRELIRSHHRLYINSFNGNLTPKFHHLLHYPTIIQIMGPLMFLCCAKFEAFHRISKKHAHVVNCRINILHTLATKLQLHLSYKFLNKDGFENIVYFGKLVKTYRVDRHTGLNIFHNYNEYTFIRINGTIYRPSYAIQVMINNENNPVFGLITKIISNNKLIFFGYKLCVTLGFNDHIKAYQIILPPKNSVEKKFLFNFNHFIKPVKIHTTSDGYNVIARRAMV